MNILFYYFIYRPKFRMLFCLFYYIIQFYLIFVHAYKATESNDIDSGSIQIDCIITMCYNKTHSTGNGSSLLPVFTNILQLYKLKI